MKVACGVMIGHEKQKRSAKLATMVRNGFLSVLHCKYFDGMPAHVGCKREQRSCIKQQLIFAGAVDSNAA